MDIKLLKSARKTVLEMLADRGFIVPDSQLQISEENFTAMYDNNTVNIHVSRSGGNSVVASIDTVADQDGDDDEETGALPVKKEAEDMDNELIEGGGEEEDGEYSDDNSDDEEDVLEDVVEDPTEHVDNQDVGEEEYDGEEVVAIDETDFTISAAGHISQILPYEQRGGAHSNQVYVYFHISSSKFDKKRFVERVEKIKETYGNNDINIIFVIQEATAPVLKESEKEAYRNVEIFDFKSLRVNYSRNRIVPYHQLLTPHEISEVAEKYGMTDEDVFRVFPRIYTTDQMACYYGLREGDICRIVNRNTGEVEYCAVYKGLRGEKEKKNTGKSAAKS